MGDDPKTDVYATTQPGARTRVSMTDIDSAQTLLPPKGYEVRELIGRGGMGEVLVADDIRIGRQVAYKRMREQAVGPALTRFLREARIQARLDHPAIVPVYELAVDEDGRPYFTMKRVTGVTLSHRLADGGAQSRILRAFVDVCLAIEYAHARGVVHRDLKPSNIMLGNYGEVYVLDWGIARVIAEPLADDAPEPLAHHDIQTFDETKTGALLGTPGYMAPEQLRGLTPMPAADVYALGAILFEILTSQPLHPRGEAAIGSTLAKPQQAPSSRAADVPPELDALCVAALSEEPSERPTAHELAEAVQRYLDGDRDHERRRRLAAEQMDAAHAALATDRALAMRHAGRALALDPESPDAAQLVSSLLLEPPSPMPAPLVEAIEDHERTISQHRSWRAVWAYMSIVAVAPLLLVLDVRSWTMVAAFYGVVLVGVLVSLSAARAGRPSIAAILVVNLALAVLFTRLVGPFILTPLAICCMLVAITAVRRVNARPWLVVAWTATAVLLPIVLEVVGALPRSWAIGRGATYVFSSVFESRGTTGEAVALVTANLVFTLVVALVALAISRKRQDSQRALFVREWHLRQLIPTDGAQRVSSK